MERAREGVVILLNNVWHSAVVDFGCVSSRILWIKFKFQGLKFVWWWGMVPMKEMVKKDMERHGLCILGDLNRWIGDRTTPGITDSFGVPGKNDNGRRVVKFWAKRGLCVGNTF